MNKERAVILSIGLVFALLLSVFSVSAANETSADVSEKAYKCLESQIKDRGNLSLKEATFSAMARGSVGNVVSRIEADKDAKSCWPKNACKLKETAQVALAYKGMSKSTSDIESWILSKNASAPDLKWFLEIDITNKMAATCKIKDGTKENTVQILANAQIQGSPGSCLSIDNNGFMLKINTNCLKNTFEISCDQDFITSTLYQKNSGGTVFVLPGAHSAASLGSTTESVNGECLKTDAGCDYEGTLWAALALLKMGEDVSRFLPYLLALSDDNTKFFPSTFLYILVGGEDQYNLIIQEQKQGKFWEVAGTRDGRYYDTSLAMMALNGNGAGELDSAKEYLASIQTKEGCWNNNNIRDTAFILYSGWPRGVSSAGEVSSPPDCEPQFSCENSFDCTQAGGTVEYNYACPSVGQACCSVKVLLASCLEKKGIVCESGKQECSGGGVVESSSDGPCCIGGSCVDIAEDTCTSAGGTCLYSCGDKEVISSSGSCIDSSQSCCVAKKGSSLWIWIVLLIILIAAAALGIIYREKVKMWWFKLMEKFKKKTVTPVQPAGKPALQGARPGAPFAPFMRPMPVQQRPIVRPAPAKFVPKPRDKEMEEALKKLKEMSKK
jgi:hypothetical protein